MERTLLTIAKRLRPELETMNRAEQVAGLADVLGFLYAGPLVLLGLVWLAVVTDLKLLGEEWSTLLILVALIFLFERLRFYVYLYVDALGGSVWAEGSVSSVVTWSGALLLGPSAFWLPVLVRLIDFIRRWQSASTTDERWGATRSFSLRVASMLPTGLLALALFERWGGNLPLSGLSLSVILPALYSILIAFLSALLIHAPYILYVGARMAQLTEGAASTWMFLGVASVGLFLPELAAPFGILAAGLYTQNGLAIFLLFFGGLLMGTLMARQFSQTVERSQQRSRELEKLEQLGRAIMSAPPDASTLPALLQEHVPAMFPSSWIEIRRFPDQILVRYPDSDDWPAMPTSAWDWVRTTTQAHHFSPHQVRPWDHSADGQSQPTPEPLVIAPVLDTETAEPIGGIYLTPRRDASGVSSLLPAVQSLAAQISSALHSAHVYTQALEHQRVEHELALAGRIQTRFLPGVLPDVPGWQLAVTLEPARQTSGDFYDVIPLPNGRLGILVADVADKGMGAALYMAFSRTLIRTYAVEHHARPDFALRVANNRILTDTQQVDLFVTVFYGVLDPLTGRLTYCNAGHNPPFLFKAQDGHAIQRLTRTGIPLGIFRGQTWEQRTVQLDVGDVLVLYTDGIVEAQDGHKTFFGEERLLAVAQVHLADSARGIQSALMQEIHTFVGDAPQFDDIALMVLVREA
jgi:serine phosphatase RsbU (regulator of sigma subunit)